MSPPRFFADDAYAMPTPPRPAPRYFATLLDIRAAPPLRRAADDAATLSPPYACRHAADDISYCYVIAIVAAGVAACIITIFRQRPLMPPLIIF